MVDVESMCSYFANALVNESKIPFEVLTAILDLWEDPVKRPKIRLKPCWIALLQARLEGWSRTRHCYRAVFARRCEHGKSMDV